MEASNTWTESSELPGYRTKVIKRDGVTVTVHRPILSEKERIKREGAVEAALTHLARNLHKRKDART